MGKKKAKVPVRFPPHFCFYSLGPGGSSGALRDESLLTVAEKKGVSPADLLFTRMQARGQHSSEAHIFLGLSGI